MASYGKEWNTKAIERFEICKYLYMYRNRKLYKLFVVVTILKVLWFLVEQLPKIMHKAEWRTDRAKLYIYIYILYVYSP